MKLKVFSIGLISFIVELLILVTEGSYLNVQSKLLTTNDITHANHEDSYESQVYGNNLNPIILIPGDGGSRLQAKLDRQDVVHHYCERKSNDWFDLWLNLSLLVPFAIDCWVEK